jgi:hypothetical protein
MGFFGRLKTGWQLAMGSFRVIRGNPRLAIFPLIGGIAGMVYMALLFGGAFVTGMFQSDVTGFAVLFLFYLGSSFIAAFFNAALVWSVGKAFVGEDVSVKAGLAAAWKQRKPLFAWAVISAVVGIVLRAIESQDNIVARILAMFVSVAWGILTYFIIPVIVFEDVGVREMFERSGKTFKDTWGETVGAGFGVGIVTAGLTLIGLVAAVGIFLLLGGPAGLAAGLAMGAIVVLGMFLLGSALSATAKTALYVYATQNTSPPEFSDVDFSRTTE